MDAELERLIDETWNLSLARIAKKDMPPTRPSLGDDIDLYVPQTRILLLMEANPAVASLVYSSAYVSANKNAYAIMKKLGMPADYFWKFEYWLKQRAYDTLRRVINKVFTTMMNVNKEGGLDVADVDVEHMRFTLTFHDCAECAGITAEKGFCYYHAATFAGIIAALINKDMDAYETKCIAQGQAACVFLIGRRDDPEIVARMADYLKPTTIVAKMGNGFHHRFQGGTVRGMGNMVNMEYYQLLVANCSLTNPEVFASSSFEVGVEYGTKLAPMITSFYGVEEMEALKRYYKQMRQLDVGAVESGSDLDIVLTECAELAVVVKKKELLGFLFGELQGLVSSLLGRKMVYKESSIDGHNLKVRLSEQPQV